MTPSISSAVAIADCKTPFSDKVTSETVIETKIATNKIPASEGGRVFLLIS
jgi:hypothetical protein